MLGAFKRFDVMKTLLASFVVAHMLGLCCCAMLADRVGLYLEIACYFYHSLSQSCYIYIILAN